MTIKAEIVADSVSPAGVRIMTMQLKYPKFIHGEFMTHRVFSRNASSSRAIPVERLIEDVLRDPVYPSFWGKNQAGMQAKEECNEPVKYEDHAAAPTYQRETAWGLARQYAVDTALAFANAGYHKQIVNRLLEPFCHINVVVTATEWQNFFDLRCHPDAQPEMRELADCMRAAMGASQPQLLAPGVWHLPYVRRDVDLMELSTHRVTGADATGALIKLSVARCARVSYLTHEGKQPDVQSDLALYERLVGAVPLHASPAEHQATPDVAESRYITLDNEGWTQKNMHGNFFGWVQYRKLLEMGLAK